MAVSTCSVQQLCLCCFYEPRQLDMNPAGICISNCTTMSCAQAGHVHAASQHQAVWLSCLWLAVVIICCLLMQGCAVTVAGPGKAALGGVGC